MRLSGSLKKIQCVCYLIKVRHVLVTDKNVNQVGSGESGKEEEVDATQLSVLARSLFALARPVLTVVQDFCERKRVSK